MLRRRVQNSILPPPDPNAGSSREERTSYQITDTGNSNMKVVVRVRPESEAELQSSCQTVVKVMDEHVVVFDAKEDKLARFERQEGRRRRPLLSRKPKDLHFAFDRIFDETATQQEVFEHTTKSILDGLLDGINCSVFAYGATGAGKTFTMLGSQDQPGVMFHTMMELYHRIDAMKSEKVCEVAVSYMEVYNETIRDLLQSSGPLTIREDGNKGLVVSGLSRHQPKSAEELLSMLASGNKKRTQHPTEANATSSRSHAVFQVFVNQKPRTASLSTQVTHAKMSLIDLAGSERATVTSNRGARMREGANINRSLLALGNCINALAQNKGKTVHVPYRNSKLTRLLKDSLGGNCRTVMIANISPSALSYEDTYNTLKYADRAKQIKTNLIRNVVNVDYHITRYKAIVNDLQKEVVELKGRLESLAPLKDHAFNFDEASRLQVMVQAVYSERCQLRRAKVDLLASERDILLRIFRKERDVGRIEALTGNNLRIAKVHSKLAYLQEHLQQVRSQLVTLDDQLLRNTDRVNQMNAEVTAAIAAETVNPSAFRSHIEPLVDIARLEAESAYQRKQTKQLLKYVKHKEQETLQTERILAMSLELICKQHHLLHCSGSLTAAVRDMYESLVRLTEGDKEVAWADQNGPDGDDQLVHTKAQQELLKSLVAMNSTPRRGSGTQRYSSPASSSVGILTSLAELKYSPARSLECQRTPAQGHPLSISRIPSEGQVASSASNGLAKKILSNPVSSHGQRRKSYPPPSPPPPKTEDTDHAELSPRRSSLPFQKQPSPLLSSTKMASLNRPGTPPQQSKHPAACLSTSSSNSSLKRLNLSELTAVHPTSPSRTNSLAGRPKNGFEDKQGDGFEDKQVNGFEDSFVPTTHHSKLAQSTFEHVGSLKETTGSQSTRVTRPTPLVISPPPPPPQLPPHLISRQRAAACGVGVIMPAVLSPLFPNGARHFSRAGFTPGPSPAVPRSPFRVSSNSAFMPSPLHTPQFSAFSVPHCQPVSTQLFTSQDQPLEQKPAFDVHQQRESSPQYQPRTDKENEESDRLNSTFTISTSSSSSSTAARTSRTNLSSSCNEADGKRDTRALAPLQSHPSSRKQPSYLALTKSAAIKRVQLNDTRTSTKENQPAPAPAAVKKNGGGSLTMRSKPQRPQLNRSASFRRSALLSNS